MFGITKLKRVVLGFLTFERIKYVIDWLIIENIQAI